VILDTNALSAFVHGDAGVGDPKGRRARVFESVRPGSCKRPHEFTQRQRVATGGRDWTECAEHVAAERAPR